MSNASWIGFVAAMAAVYGLAFLLLLPKKFWPRLAIGGILGMMALTVTHLWGFQWGAELPVNLPTCMTAGMFGIPGVVMMLVLKGILLG